MKKIMNMMLIAASTMLLATSCTDEVDKVFDQSTTERAVAAIDNVKEVLTSQPNGWVLPLYGEGGYGGINLIVKFNGDNVTATSENLHEATTSRYKVYSSTGTVLSFDDYNQVIHQFSDPYRLISGYGSNNGTGFGADLEYSVLSASKDSVVLQGRKQGLRLTMLPNTSTADSVYYNTVDSIESKMMNVSTYFYLNTDKGQYLALRQRGSRNITITNTDTKETDAYTYCVTDKGIRFLETVTTGGAYIKEIYYNESDSDEPVYSTDQASVTFNPTVAPLPVQLMSARWWVIADSIDARSRELWTAASTELMKWNTSYKPVMFYLNFGNSYVSSSYGYNLGIGYFAGYPSGTSARGWACHDIFTYEMVDAETIDLVFTSTYKGSGSSTMNGCPSMRAAVNRFVGTFKLETDDIKNATYIKMTNVNDPDNYFKLMGGSRPDAATWPFHGGSYPTE